MRHGLTKLCCLTMLGLSVAACGDLPKPFQPEIHEPNELLLLKDRAGIVVAPMEGALPTDPDLLVKAMVQQLHDLSVPASTRALNRDSWVLQGRVQGHTANPDPNQVVVAWELWNLDGRMVGAYTQRHPLPPTIGSADQTLVSQLAADAAPKIAALIQDPPERESRVPGFPDARLVVAPLAGGPGDSDQSLPTALRAQLAAAGLPLAEREQPDDILIRGQVAVEPAQAGLEDVIILWSVTGGPDRADLGQVEQRNQVPAGSLDGRWGPIAGFVAQGAAEGLIDLLNKAATP